MAPFIGLTTEEVLALPATVPIAAAARALGIGHTKAIELMKIGQFPCPVLRLGRRRFVTRNALLDVLGIREGNTAVPEPDPQPHNAGSTPHAEPHAPTPRTEPRAYVILALPISDPITQELLVTLIQGHRGSAPTAPANRG